MPETDELRAQIEAIDEQIIDLIATRMEIADELAKAKKTSNQRYWDDEKEREVKQHYRELCEEVSLTEYEAAQIAEVLLNISKERQKHIFGRGRRGGPPPPFLPLPRRGSYRGHQRKQPPIVLHTPPEGRDRGLRRH